MNCLSPGRAKRAAARGGSYRQLPSGSKKKEDKEEEDYREEVREMKEQEEKTILGYHNNAVVVSINEEEGEREREHHNLQKDPSSAHLAQTENFGGLISDNGCLEEGRRSGERRRRSRTGSDLTSPENVIWEDEASPNISAFLQSGHGEMDVPKAKPKDRQLNGIHLEEKGGKLKDYLKQGSINGDMLSPINSISKVKLHKDANPIGGVKANNSSLGSPSAAVSPMRLGSEQSPRGAPSRKPTFSKTKSRFVEQVPSPSLRIHSQAPTPSVWTFKEKSEDDTDDPFTDVDLPDKYRKWKWGLAQVLQCGLFLAILAVLVCTLVTPQLKWRTIWQLELWKWAVLIMVLFSGRLLSRWLIHISVIILERNFLLRKKVLYFVYGLRSGVQNCIWLGLALLTWQLLFNAKVERSTGSRKALSIITRLFICLLISACIWLLKILLVKVLASSFQKNTYFDRIQESLFGQYVLETLLGPPVVEMEMMTRLEEEFQMENPPNVEGNGNSKTLSTNLKDSKSKSSLNLKQLHKVDPKHVSAWNMKRLVNLVRHPHISTIADSIDELMADSRTQDSKEIEIRSESEAKAAAKRIFKNVAKPDARYIEEDDLLRFMYDEEVAKVLSLFDDAKETSMLSKSSLKNWVVKVYQERRALAYSLNDTKTAVEELHRLASVAVTIIIVIISMMILGLATQKLLVFLSSQVLLVVFVFGNTCKQVFEAIIFLFVMHPFDVGDRCIIDGSEMVVEEMNILNTVFLRPNNEKIYYPNNLLANKAISNLYRSPDMSDNYDFSIHISTPFEKINTLKGNTLSFIESNPHLWHSKVTLVLKDIEEVNRMRMTLIVQLTMNFQNGPERWARRSTLLFELKRFFEELGIEYRLLPQEVQLTHVSPPFLDRV